MVVGELLKGDGAGGSFGRRIVVVVLERDLLTMDGFSSLIEPYRILIIPAYP